MDTMYKLYSSEGCHLCEEALAICLPLIADELKVIDIVEDEHLVSLYGVHIPVLERTDIQEKLFWPFSSAQVQQLQAITNNNEETS